MPALVDQLPLLVWGFPRLCGDGVVRDQPVGLRGGRGVRAPSAPRAQSYQASGTAPLCTWEAYPPVPELEPFSLTSGTIGGGEGEGI